jgi:hypothetical protein
MIRKKDLSHSAEQVLVSAMLVGNLMMIVMFMYENLIVWVIGIVNKMKNSNNMGMEIEM